MILVKSIKRNNNFLKYYDDNYLKAIRAFSLFLPTQVVIKINTEKNIKLSEALRVKVIPTLMIYKYGEMVWRQSGDQDANTLISLMKDQLN